MAYRGGGQSYANSYSKGGGQRRIPTGPHYQGSSNQQQPPFRTGPQSHLQKANDQSNFPPKGPSGMYYRNDGSSGYSPYQTASETPYFQRSSFQIRDKRLNQALLPTTQSEQFSNPSSLLTPKSGGSSELSSLDSIDKSYNFPNITPQNHNIHKMKTFKETGKPVKISRITYDPELKKDSSKGSKPIYELVKPNSMLTKDPRNNPSFFEKAMSRSFSKPSSTFVIPKYKFDKYSVGPEPSSEVIVWSFPAMTTSTVIRNHFSQFGKIKSFKFIDDPETAVPLGMCLLKFDGDIESAHKSALKSISATHKKFMIGNQYARCGLNLENKLYDEILTRILDSKKEHEKKKLEREQRLNEQRRRDELKEKDRRFFEDLQAKKKQAQMIPPPPPAKTGLQRVGDPNNQFPVIPLKVKNTQEVKLSNHDKHIMPASSISLPQNFAKHIANRCFILIPDKYVSTRNVSSTDIRKLLAKYGCDRVLTHKTGFYVVFNTLKDAEKCFDTEDGRQYINYRVFMNLYVPDELMDKTRVADKISTVGQAKVMLTNELQNYLMKDLREKVVGPRLLDCLNNEKYKLMAEKYTIEQEELKQKKEEEAKLAKQKVEEAAQKVKQNPSILIGISPVKVNHESANVPLSSFRRASHSLLKSTSKHKPGYKNKLNIIPMSRALNFSNNQSSEEEDDNDEDEEEEESGLESADEKIEGEKTQKKLKRSIEEDESMVRQRKIAKKSLTEEITSPSASEEETKAISISQPTTPEEERPESKINEIFEMEQEVLDDLGEGEEEEEEEEGEVEVDEGAINENLVTDYSSVDEKFRPSAGLPQPVYSDDFNTINYDLNSLQHVIKDEEDFELARKAFNNYDPYQSHIKDLNYWAWKQHNIKEKTDQLIIETEKQQEENDRFTFEDEVKANKSLQNSTGSFRTQGYHKIPDKLKGGYLPHRRRVNQPLNTVHTEDDHEILLSNVQSSRVNRANNRRFAADITAQKQILGSETDILDLNQLTKRKKPVQFARSAIHNWGLYALEPIAAREMIIEYVGERLRQAVAEVREKRYLRSGIGSSYLFRIDENTVIDASKKGGIARFINHCCIPSCTAKIIKVEGKKRIVIYALRDIGANEELTYDYKFERETNDEERIPCLCGAPGCKGYLN